MSFGAQAAQLCHAMRQFVEEHPAIDRSWFSISNYICLLKVVNELELQNLFSKARELEIACSAFREPDLGNQLTAICLEPGRASKKLVSRLKLAFR